MLYKLVQESAIIKPRPLTMNGQGFLYNIFERAGDISLTPEPGPGRFPVGPGTVVWAGGSGVSGFETQVVL